MSNDTDTLNPEGQLLANNRYRVLQKLGEGGMATVYKAHDNNLEQDVVIKIPKANLLADSEYVKRFTREIRALVKLNHPHIVKVQEVGEHEGLPYVVMQYLTGGSLQDQMCVSKDGVRSPGPLTALTSWLGKVASALDFIHQQGYVHRDVKPANILFDAHGNAYLSDFGIAKVLASADPDNKQSVSLTGAGVVLGTPAYMGPEFVMGLPYDGRIDQYALAVTVYEIMVGRTPFEATNPGAMLVKQTTEIAKPIRELMPNVSFDLSQAVQKGLSKDPANRFPTCTAFAEAVLRYYGNTAVSGPRVPAGLRQTDAAMSQQTVTQGAAGSPSKQMPTTRGAGSGTVSTAPGAPRPSATPTGGTRIGATGTTRPSTLIATQRPQSSKMPLLIGGGLAAVCVIGAAGFFMTRGTSKDAPAPAPVASARNDASPSPGTDISSQKVPSSASTANVKVGGEILRFGARENGPVRCMAVSKDGKLILSGNVDGSLHLWNVETGAETAKFKLEGSGDTPLGVAIIPGTPDKFLVGSTQAISAYDQDSKKLIKIASLPGAKAVAFFPDGQRAVVGTDKELQIWNLQTGTSAGAFSDTPIPPVRSLFVSEDGRAIVSGHGKGDVGSKGPGECCVLLWDAASGKDPKRFLKHTDEVTSVALSKGGKYIVSASFDQSVLLWNVETTDVVAADIKRTRFVAPIVKDGNRMPLPLGVAFSPDATHALFSLAGAAMYSNLSDFAEGLPLKGEKGDELNEMVPCVAFEPSGKRGLTAGGDGIIRIWKLEK